MSNRIMVIKYNTTMSTEAPIKNKRVVKKINEAFEMVKAVNDLNVAQASNGDVDRLVVERVVKLAYRDAGELLGIFVEKEITRTIDSILEILNNK